MIKGIGIDAVDIERFAPWTHYPRKRLMRIYSATELVYCFQTPSLAAQRLALRFAIREAFFKALSGVAPHHTVPFLTLCRHLVIERAPSGALNVMVDWSSLQAYGLQTIIPSLQVHVSATHTASTAIAWVIIETP